MTSAFKNEVHWPTKLTGKLCIGEAFAQTYGLLTYVTVHVALSDLFFFESYTNKTVPFITNTNGSVTQNNLSI
jgi:hypothetical protein